MPPDQKDRAAPAVLDGQEGKVLDELGQLRGRLDDICQRMAALEMAEDQHQVELDTAKAEAAEFQAALREWQAKAEEWRRQLKETKHRLDAAEARCRRADEDRSAVIAALGRKGRRLLGTAAPTDA
jgi:predicted  nucleic acid-binding Zn-ribbon protein